MWMLGWRLSLLAFLLSLIFAYVQPVSTPQKWPYNVPASQRYWPEHQQLIQRHESASSFFESDLSPTGLRKMSGDPAEMFFLHYWDFEGPAPSDSDAGAGNASRTDMDLARRASIGDGGMERLPMDYTSDNLSATLLPPLLPHSANDERLESPLILDEGTNVPRLLPRALLSKRAFQCPSNTTACNSINAPDSCCGTDETCVSVPDTGLGTVGCCPNGQDCGGSVAQCNTDAGYHSCPGSSNGGCCIPGFMCEDVGCVAGGVATSTVRPTVTVTVTSGASNPPPPTSGSTTISSASASSNNTPSSNSTVNTMTITTTVSPYPNVTSCVSGYITCDSSQGGGCCSSGLVCVGSGSCGPASTTGGDLAPPARPTSVVTTTQSLCPTGYYMCSAFYVPGCCQVDRSCSSTSCVLPASTTIVSDQQTIVEPIPGGAVPQTSASESGNVSVEGGQAASTTTVEPGGAAASGQCAQGWYNCASEQGGGCCPSGYSCGGTCAKTAQSTQGPAAVSKVPPADSGATSINPLIMHWSWLAFGIVILFAD